MEGIHNKDELYEDRNQPKEVSLGRDFDSAPEVSGTWRQDAYRARS